MKDFNKHEEENEQPVKQEIRKHIELTDDEIKTYLGYYRQLIKIESGEFKQLLVEKTLELEKEQRNRISEKN